MPKITYKYDDDFLSLNVDDKARRSRIVKLGFTVIVAFVVAFSFGYVYADQFVTPKQVQLANKNAVLLNQYEALNTQISEASESIRLIARHDDVKYRPLLGQEPLPFEVRNVGTGGSDAYASLESYSHFELMKATQLKLDDLENVVKVQDKSFNELVTYVDAKQEEIQSTPSINPMSQEDITRYSGHFGMRHHPVHKVWKFHDGIDLTGPMNSNIYATGDGIVLKAGLNRHGYGNEVVIQHHGNIITRYAHLNKVLVEKGGRVVRGEVVGLLGNTGVSTGPHLHYEVRRNRKSMNPKDFFLDDLSQEQYNAILARAAKRSQK